MQDGLSDANKKTAIFTDIKKNITYIQEKFGGSDDLQIRTFHVGTSPSTLCALFYIDGAANSQSINELVDSLVFRAKDIHLRSQQKEMWEEFAQIGGTAKPVKDLDDVIKAMLSGQTSFLVDQNTIGYAISTEGWDQRGLEESQNESIVRGPRESFIENLRTNTALIRKRLKDPNLRIKSTPLGNATQTMISLVYLKGKVDQEALAKIEKQIENIHIEGVLESGYVEQLISNRKWSLFPTLQSTERPDVTVAGILEGRIAIIVDGSPFVLIAPIMFNDFFQTAEDYYLPPAYSLITRSLRYLSFLIMLLTTSLYITATTFQQELLPNQLLISFIVQREDVPFPVYVEALLLIGTYEILREAVIRMPKSIGSALSIVSGIVFGSAVISAGFVSDALLILVAIEAVASFILPTAMSTPVRLIRFGMITLAALFGLVGIFIGVMLLLIHLCNLESFGVPYMSPRAPFIRKEQKDSLFRFPWALTHIRPNPISLQSTKKEG